MINVALATSLKKVLFLDFILITFLFYLKS